MQGVDPDFVSQHCQKRLKKWQETGTDGADGIADGAGAGWKNFLCDFGKRRQNANMHVRLIQKDSGAYFALSHV